MTSITASAVSLQVCKRGNSPWNRASRLVSPARATFLVVRSPLLAPTTVTSLERTSSPPLTSSFLGTRAQTTRARPFAARRASFAGAAVRCVPSPQIASRASIHDVPRDEKYLPSPSENFERASEIGDPEPLRLL